MHNSSDIQLKKKQPVMVHYVDNFDAKMYKMDSPLTL